MATKKSSNRGGKGARQKKNTKLTIIICVLIAVVVVAAVVVYFVKPDLYHKFIGLGEHTWGEYTVVSEEDCGNNGLKKHTCSVCGYTEEVVIPATGNHTFDGEVCTVCGYDKSSPEGSFEGVQSSGLSIHFIKFDNDNAGDSVLIKCGDTEVLIDAGSTQASATTIKAYIDDYVTDDTLEYVIATHADQDHIAGLVGTSSGGTYNGILYSYNIGTIIRFDRTNKDEATASGNRTLYGKFLDAVAYAEANKGATTYTASQCWYELDGAQKTYYLDSENKVSMNILYNYYYENNSSDENNYSVCMLLSQEISAGEYKHYLFTGDLEEKGEEYLVQYNTLPEVELFKAGHHGSPTSSNDCLLSVIKPKYVAVCCCAGTDEYTDTIANQFPSQAFIDRVAPYTDYVFVTNMISDNDDGYAPMNGNIVFYIDGTKLKFWCSENTTKLKDTDWFKENRTCPASWQTT
ncbi:MAG: MBL fold metallo-hydrolase [Candidatus Coproplasma sp.]